MRMRSWIGIQTRTGASVRASALCLALAVVMVGCGDEEPVGPENPGVVPEVVAECGADRRLVTDVCTQLGPDDGCVKIDDVCVALCDGRTSCTTVGELRVVNPRAVAPDGYCVECAVP